MRTQDILTKLIFVMSLTASVACGDDPAILGPSTFGDSDQSGASLDPNGGPLAEAAEQAGAQGMQTSQDPALAVTLKWTDDTDLDLHLVQPNGEEVYYRNRETDAGAQFLKDSCIASRCASGTERVEEVRYQASAPSGTYSVSVVNYDGLMSGTADLEVNIRGEIKTFTIHVGDQAGTTSQDVEFDVEPPNSVNAGAASPDIVRGPVALTVYTANVENLPKTSDQCAGDWRDLYSYMAVQGAKPDIFLVQQISDVNQLNQLTAHMTAVLGRPYAGVIADASPAPFNSPCGAAKDRQTNAIVYATDRMTPSGAPFIWKSYKNVNGACVLDGLSRTRGIALKFRDAVSNEFVSAASIHWSTRNGGGPDTACAVANARQTDQVFQVHYPDSSLYVFGGDTNEPDTETHKKSSAYNGWYAQTNGDIGGALGYMDPVWRDCKEGDLRACLINNWTFRGANSDRRIDFIFARTPAGLPGLRKANVVTFNQANAADLQQTGKDSPIGYSDHRSVLARLAY